MYLQQISMLQALGLYSTCIYDRSVYRRLCFVNAGLGCAHVVLLLYMRLEQVWVLQVCVIIVHVLTTGLGDAGFVLLSMYLP